MLNNDEAILIHPDNLPLFKKRLGMSSEVHTGPFSSPVMFGIPLVEGMTVPKSIKTEEFYSLPDYQLIDEGHRLEEGFYSYGIEDLPYLVYVRRVTNIVPVFIWRKGGGYKTIRLTSTGSTVPPR